MPDPSTAPALVTGVTGYIGSRLAPALIAAGKPVRVMTRDASRLDGQPWRDEVEVVEGDATDPDDLERALTGVGQAYYLLHSMDDRGDFMRRDRDLAMSFARICEITQVERIVYLGGLHPDGELSDHLASRTEVGEIFVESRVPAAVLQAAVIVGSGSASFEMLRHLTNRLPLMIAPRWLKNRIQPIAIRDVLHYLVAAGDLPRSVNRTFDIGGPGRPDLPRDDRTVCRRRRTRAAPGHHCPGPDPGPRGALGRGGDADEQRAGPAAGRQPGA